jgi:cytochrome oxidase Cu insertion factor (SCO1/SenC/PrrC family)
MGFLLAASLWGQPGRNETDAAHAFVKKAPTLGEPFPDLTAYDAEGEPFDLARLRGNITVVTFGCLT